ncbi:MAG TPA: hypothetical protein VH575_29150 [Gemmataceae bacterium]|jgi:hypothetical protein
MFQQFCAVLIGFLVVPPLVDRKGEPKVVGDPTGVYRRTLADTTWVRGDPKTADRIELTFDWQQIIRNNRSTKRPAVTIVFYREGKVTRFAYGPVFLEKSGKHLLKRGDRLYRYHLHGKTIRFEEYKYTPPFEFETGEKQQKEEEKEPDKLFGVWTRKSGPPPPAYNIYSALMDHLVDLWRYHFCGPPRS